MNKFDPTDTIGGGGGFIYGDGGSAFAIPDGDGINNCGGCGECHECTASKT